MKVRIGGQAVMEGVMMKNEDRYAVSVRKPDGEIETKTERYMSISDKYSVLKLPVLRGVVNFAESMVVGMKTLTYSADFIEDGEEEPSRLEQWLNRHFSEKWEGVLMGGIVVLSFAIAIGLFMVLPYFLSNIFEGFGMSRPAVLLLEGLIRVGIFLGYIILISRMNDIKRVFMYHGAEHKTINCLEAGEELTPENVMKYSRLHKRCGTSFLFFVMIISIIFFFFIRVDTVWLKVALRLLLVPVIAGVSYEFIRLAGNSDNPVITALSKPGLCLQLLTTKEPDESMIEVAIRSVEGVFDWKTYLEKERKNRE